MTEKRFRVTDNTDNPFLCDWSVTDYADGGIVHHPMTSENMANVMCDLLNAFNDENEQLKSFNQDLSENLSVCANKRLAQGEYLTKLTNENEQLKQSNKNAWNLIKFIYDEIKEDGSMDWGRIQDLVEF